MRKTKLQEHKSVKSGRLREQWKWWRWFCKRACCGSRACVCGLVFEEVCEQDVLTLSADKSKKMGSMSCLTCFCL